MAKLPDKSNGANVSSNDGGCFGSFHAYWKNYGGWRALLFSPYLHASIILGLFLSLFNLSYPWWEKCIDIIPSMLGFSLAGYAIFLAIGAGSFQELLARAGGGEKSVLNKISSAFLHYVIVQSVVLVASISVDAVHTDLLEWIRLKSSTLDPELAWLISVIKYSLSTIGYAMLFYPIACGLGGAFWVFKQVDWFVIYINRNHRK